MYDVKTVIDFCHNGWGEDRIVALENTFGVLDGATPINAAKIEGYHTEAEWMADTFVTFLKDSENASLPQDFPYLCQGFVNSVVKSDALKNIPVLDYPCLTLSVLTLENNLLNAYLLGDCELHILLKDKRLISLTDKRSRNFSNLTCRAIEKAKNEGRSPEEASKIQRYENRKHINMKDGYYVLSPCGTFEKGLQRLSLPLDEVHSVLCCTDGFARLFSLESSPKPQDFLSGGLTLSQGLEILRNHEKSKHIPGEVKRHDDAAALCLFLNK